MKYFLKITSTYKPKNKLQEELLHYVKQIDHTLLHGEVSLVAMKEVLLETLAEYNQAFPRCTPLSISFGNFYQDKDAGIFCHDVFNMSIYKVLEEIKDDSDEVKMSEV